MISDRDVVIAALMDFAGSLIQYIDDDNVEKLITKQYNMFVRHRGVLNDGDAYMPTDRWYEHLYVYNKELCLGRRLHSEDIIKFESIMTVTNKRV